MESVVPSLFKYFQLCSEEMLHHLWDHLGSQRHFAQLYPFILVILTMHQDPGFIAQ